MFFYHFLSYYYLFKFSPQLNRNSDVKCSATMPCIHAHARSLHLPVNELVGGGCGFIEIILVHLINCIAKCPDYIASHTLYQHLVVVVVRLIASCDNFLFFCSPLFVNFCKKCITYVCFYIKPRYIFTNVYVIIFSSSTCTNTYI